MINLEKYTKSIHIVGCPSDCPFRRRGEEKGLEPPIVPLPLSGKISGVIISRDPTIDWLCVYRHAMTHEDEFSRRLMLYTSAIPNMVCGRIRQFAKGACTEEHWERLHALVYNNTYWTHFNKCYTVMGSKEFGFNWSNASRCAHRWLGPELELAVKEGAQFIIVLGRDAQAWVDKNTSDAVRSRMIKLIHPSGQNNAIWARKHARTEEQQERRARQIAETHESVQRILRHAGLMGLEF